MIFKIQFLILIIQFGFKHNSTHVIFLIFLISVLQLIKFILLNGHLFKSIDLFQIPKIKLNRRFKIKVLKFQNYLMVFCFVLIIALFQITFGSISSIPSGLVSGSSQIISILQPLNQFTSSLDNTFATDAELAVTTSNLSIDMGVF